ncbi:choice-of-anchor Q domain-containing protein [Spirosoma validum]|uniref:choice-of-anchor Q domain-containing protein n=1 Tax=Spirosoma validum TaxID=2771355 RepID=UPI00293B8755|nr:choice-of-anchor Q domain-containing protein [Spirosoma validum]
MTASSSPFASPLRFQLQADSPAVNAGSNAAYTGANGPATDLGGQIRIQNGTIDMGAYEFSLPPDLTPILYARPSIAVGTTDITLVVDVVELNGVATSGSLTLKLTKDAKVTLSWPQSATFVGGRGVKNEGWTFSETDPNYYVLTSSQVIGAGDKLSVGLRGVLRPGATTGVINLSVIVLPSGMAEARTTNNADADKIEYFQQ